MITFSKLGLLGNLGNQLFQIAGTIGLAQKHGHDYALPAWQYVKNFKNSFTTGTVFGTMREIQEKHYHHHEWDIPEKGHYSLKGWLQSEKYWEDSKQDIRTLFEFKEDFKDSVKKKIAPEAFLKPTIAISIRRGDYIGNTNYITLPPTYFILALLEHFPNWKDYNLFFFSDDIPYCKIHFECLPNAYFADHCGPIEQLCLGSMCDNFILANSTFSWWMAYLGEKGEINNEKGELLDSKVIRPAYLFDGDLLKVNDSKDFYPDRWTPFDHVGKKIDLRDFTFTIPVHYDHLDRKQNVELSVCMLQRDLDTRVIIGEQGSTSFEYTKTYSHYVNFSEMKVFHRTKMLNDMAMAADTPFVVNWDADVFVPPMQIYLAAEALRSGQDMVYPYDGRFARVPRRWFTKLEKLLDVGIFGDTQFKGKNGHPLPISSVGGAVMFNKESFIEGGMENEQMVSYAPEDCERYDRFGKLGYKILRIPGTLYHLDHFCGLNSTNRNPHFKANHDKLDKIRAMSVSELRSHLESWQWVHKYTERYYRKISPSAITSARQIYSALEVFGIKPKTVIDVGCGIGEWGQDVDFGYFGLDYKVPKKSLLIPQHRYIDFDLTGGPPFPDADRFDLVICLEVLEHLPEENASPVIEFLCSLGDRVLFSAAIPYQSGVGHINEKFQTYWAEIFSRFGFYPSVNQIREMIADDNLTDIWYRQNIVIYEKDGKGSIADYVHPQMYLNVVRSLSSRG